MRYHIQYLLRTDLSQEFVQNVDSSRVSSKNDER